MDVESKCATTAVSEDGAMDRVAVVAFGSGVVTAIAGSDENASRSVMLFNESFLDTVAAQAASFVVVALSSGSKVSVDRFILSSCCDGVCGVGCLP